MYKILISTCVATLLSAGICSAEFIGTSTITTVSEALNLNDDTPVTLEGKITRHLRKDKYLFADDTGTVTVEIEHKDWNGTDVKPTDIVRIRGEMDKDWYDTKIDVDSVEIIP